MIELLIEGMTENRGGKETYIINIFKYLDKNKYHLTFVSYNDQIAYETILKRGGAEIVWIPPRHKGLYKHRKALINLFQKKHFDILWSHKTTLSACEILSIAKKNAVSVRIIHSHCSSNMGGRFTFLMHNINKKRIFNIANEYLACSDSAAKWFYGKHPALIAVNGIELEKFRFNSKIRDSIRRELNLGDAFVLGHIGRFGIEKNHKKLINIFHACRQNHKNIKLILCGDGEERENIEKQIKELGLCEDVILSGVINNVNEVLQAMDMIVMTSLFEGLPYALLEAQTAGLKCIVSDTVSKEVDILGWNKFLSLKLSDTSWAKVILNESINYDRSIGYTIMKKRGFDLCDCLCFLEDRLEQSLK